MPAWSRVIKAGQVPKFSDAGDRHGQLHATQGLERFHDGVEPPGLAMFVECWFQPMEPFGVFGHRPPVFLKDEVRRWGGTHNLAEPAPVRWAPGSPAGIPAVMPEQHGFAAQLGRLQIMERLFTRTAQVTNGFVCDLGDLDRREIPGAHQPGPWDGIPTIGVDAVASLLGDQGGGDDPAIIAFVGQRAVEPVPPRSRFRDEDSVVGFGLQLARELINVAWPRANGA